MWLRFPFLVFCAYNMVQPANAGEMGLGADLPGAAPRTLVTLGSTVVRVADLFQNAGTQAQTVLGAAPAPGGRIVVGADQLAAIAAAYQVPWAPNGSNPEVVLASPGSAIPVSAIQSAIANAVVASGGPMQAAVTLPDFSPPMIPPGSKPAVTVTRMNFDPATDNFSASLVIDAAGMSPENLDLTGLALPSVRAVVAAHDLAVGELLEAKDVVLAQLPENQAAGALTSPEDAIGMAVSSGVQAGGAVAANDLSTPIVIRKGMFVVLNLSAPGMTLTAQGVSLNAGGVGDMIQVMNPASHAVVQAVVTGPGAASIAPGSTPLNLPQGNGGYAGHGSYAQAHGARPMAQLVTTP